MSPEHTGKGQVAGHGPSPLRGWLFGRNHLSLTTSLMRPLGCSGIFINGFNSFGFFSTYTCTICRVLGIVRFCGVYLIPNGTHNPSHNVCNGWFLRTPGCMQILSDATKEDHELRRVLPFGVADERPEEVDGSDCDLSSISGCDSAECCGEFVG